jgi:hypothetical protein
LEVFHVGKDFGLCKLILKTLILDKNSSETTPLPLFAFQYGEELYLFPRGHRIADQQGWNCDDSYMFLLGILSKSGPK